MAQQVVQTTHTPNQGRLLWNANDTELYTRVGGFINLREYASAGNNVTIDDRAAIQAASDAAAALRVPLVWPPGRYAISSSIVPSSGSQWITENYYARYAAGSSTDPITSLPVQIVPHSSMPSGTVMVDGRTKWNIHMRGIEVRGNGSTSYGFLGGTANQADSGILYGNHVFEFCSFPAHARGMWMKECTYNRNFNLMVGGCITQGVYLEKLCGDSDYVNCFINDTQKTYAGTDPYIGAGLLVRLSGEVRVAGGKYENNSKGIVFEDALGCSVTGVNFHDNYSRHLHLKSLSSTSTTGVNLTGSRFLGGGYINQSANSYRVHVLLEAATGRRVNFAASGNSFRQSYLGTWDYETNTTDFGPDWGVIVGTGAGTIHASVSGNDCDSASVVNSLWTDNTLNAASHFEVVNNSKLTYDVQAGTLVRHDQNAIAAVQAVTTPGYTFTLGGRTGSNRFPITVASAASGAILPAGPYNGKRITIINRSANAVTFATDATSRVAGGTAVTVPLSRSISFVWDADYAGASTGRWVREAT